jgi:ABC-2 type transport system permease protein
MTNIQWTAYRTLIWREVHRIFRIWTQTLLPPAITISLYFLIFGNFIGKRIGEFHGVPYINFIVPGLIMMSVVTNSFGNVVSSFYGARFQRNIEEMLVSPMSSTVLLLGFISGGVIRGILIGTIVTTISLFFCNLTVFNLAIIIYTILLTSALFSIAGLINAIFARNFDDTTIVLTFVLTPLTYLGGIFYSIKMLPPLWQNLSLLNPIFHLVSLFRYGFLGISDVPVIQTLIGLTLLVISLGTWANWLIKNGVGIRT